MSKMNRRRLLAFLATTPLAAFLPKWAIAKPATTLPEYPVGCLMDVLETVPENPFLACSPMIAVVRRKMWNGETFIDFESHEATTIMNRLLHTEDRK